MSPFVSFLSYQIPDHNHRSATLPATMPQTIIQCSENLLNASRQQRKRRSIGRRERSSKTIIATVPQCHSTNNKCSCLAHVINLATQALIGSYSKAPHYDPKDPEAHIPADRDEVGLVRSIVVKVRLPSTNPDCSDTMVRNGRLQRERKCGRPSRPRQASSHCSCCWICAFDGHRHL